MAMGGEGTPVSQDRTSSSGIVGRSAKKEIVRQAASLGWLLSPPGLPVSRAGATPPEKAEYRSAPAAKQLQQLDGRLRVLPPLARRVRQPVRFSSP